MANNSRLIHSVKGSGMAALLRAAATKWIVSEGNSAKVSHRIHRGTLVPFVAGLFAVLLAGFIAAQPVLAGTGTVTVTAGANGATGAGGTDDVRAQEWWLSGLDVRQAWHVSQGAGVTVAVLSTGVSPTQPDLAGDVITGPDYIDSGRAMGGPYWGLCGTAVASIIAGHGHGTDNNSGIMGIAPTAKILSVQVTLEYNDPLNATTAITQRLTQAIADGIVYAANHGAKVIDLPLDPGTFGLAGDGAAAGGSPAELSAVRYALGKGVVLVAPAGDNGGTWDQVNYPAAYPGVIAVGAVGHDGQLASFSSNHSYVTLTAPGAKLMAATLLPAQTAGYVAGYAPISTTAVASGMVAGVAALIVSRYPDLTPSEVARALHESATGATAIVNAARAVQDAALLARTTSSKPAPSPTAIPVKPHPATHPAPVSHKAPPVAGGTAARTVLRDAVFGATALILLVIGLILITWSLRRRTRVPHAHGVREQGRLARGAAGPAEAGQVAGSSLRRAASPGSPAVAGRPVPTSADWHPSSDWHAPSERPAAADWHQPPDWPGSSGFQGRSLGELAYPVSIPRRPLIEPLPRSAATGHPPAGPPWAPASTPDAPGNHEPFGGPDLTVPFAGRDVLTQSSYGLAAAPVPADYPMPVTPPAPDPDPDEDPSA
jgi:Subtilase family